MFLTDSECKDHNGAMYSQPTAKAVIECKPIYIYTLYKKVE